MEERNDLLLSNHLCFSIYAASREMIKLYTPLLKEIKLTYPQYLVMIVMWEHNTITFKDLGKKLYLDSGTLTPVIKKLTDAGLITRTRSDKDERTVILTITDKGLSLKEKVRKVPLQIFEKTCLEQGDYDHLNYTVRDLLSNLIKNEN